MRERLGLADEPDVIAHVDFEAHNLVWRGDRPVLVYDWDSLAIRPTSAIAGHTAAIFPTNGRDVVAATVEQSSAFLDAYGEVDDRVAWTAGLWVLAFNAKKETCGGAGGYVRVLEEQLDERLRRAGL